MKKIKILLLAVFVSVVCICLSACDFLHLGQSGNSNNSSVSSENNTDNSNNEPEIDTDGTFIFNGSSIKAASTSISGEIVIPEEHNGNVIDTIPSEAFKGCKSITSIIVPESILSIGEGAFMGCSLLRSITLPFVGSQKGNSGNTASSLGYIFGEDRYEGCTYVDSYYGGYSSWCIPTTLREVTITNETIIANGAFSECSMLTKINLNDGILQAGISAFQGCKKIEEINLPNITIISSSILSGCLSLQTFNIGESVDTIGSNAFSGCSALSSVNSEENGTFIIPDSVTSIGESAFNGCSLLKKLTLPFIGSQRGNSGNTASLFGYIFGDDSYQGGYLAHYATYYSWCIPTALREVTITNETIVASKAFIECTMITKITINSAAKNSVGANAFPSSAQIVWN